MMFAAMVEGKADTAEWFFLIAVILAALATVAHAVRNVEAARWAPVLLAAAVTFVALAFWVL
jgi:hypothetical protein